MNALRIPGDFDAIKVLNPHSNIDYWYGPYNNLAQAIETTADVKSAGLTVGVMENGQVVEYWYQTINNSLELIKKIADLTWE